MNKKGFTLVELLAVIVILAVVMLIGGTTVLPMMQKAQKSSLGTEGVSLKKAAENAFQTELIKGAGASFKSTDKVCFSMQYLCKTGAFDKGCDGLSAGDKYAGSVLVTPATGASAVTDYKMWVTNNTYSFNNLGDANITNPEKADSTLTTTNISSCGKAVTSNKISGYVYCTYDGSAAKCYAAA